MARRKLPFVVQPRLAPIKEIIGTPESGQIEIERRGFLSVAEKSFIQYFEDSDDAKRVMQTTALRIAAEVKLEPSQVFSMLGEFTKHPELTPFYDDIATALGALEVSQRKLVVVKATCLLTHRIDAKWQVEDTLQLHEDMIYELANFYDEEERKSLEALEAAVTKDEAKDKEAPLGKE